jgi:hypothetical protein
VAILCVPVQDPHRNRASLKDRCKALITEIIQIAQERRNQEEPKSGKTELLEKLRERQKLGAIIDFWECRLQGVDFLSRYPR